MRWGGGRSLIVGEISASLAIGAKEAPTAVGEVGGASSVRAEPDLVCFEGARSPCAGEGQSLVVGEVGDTSSAHGDIFS